MNKIKKFRSSLFLIGLFFAESAQAFEARYPFIPGVGTLNPDSGIGEYISYFFGILIYIGGAIALVSFAIGGAQYIMSGDSPENSGNAKDRMKGSILGLVLTVSSFILIKTINPAMATPTITPLPSTGGVFFTNGSVLKPAPLRENNIASIPVGYHNLVYKCNENGPALLVWIYPDVGLSGFGSDGIDGVQIFRVACGQSLALGGSGSYKMAFETPGIYYCLGNCQGQFCTGFMSEANLTDQKEIPEVFKNKIRSIRIVNGFSNGIALGAIFHQDKDFTGTCSNMIPQDARFNSRESYCIDVLPETTGSVNIFKWNYKLNSGDGVTFYSTPHGYRTGSYAGYRSVGNDLINPVYVINPSAIIFDYTNVDVPPEVKRQCVSFGDCPGSVEVKGKYLVVVSAAGGYCEVFNQNISNMKGTKVGAQGRQLGDIYIIPVR